MKNNTFRKYKQNEDLSKSKEVIHRLKRTTTLLFTSTSSSNIFKHTRNSSYFLLLITELQKWSIFFSPFNIEVWGYVEYTLPLGSFLSKLQFAWITREYPSSLNYFDTFQESAVTIFYAVTFFLLVYFGLLIAGYYQLWKESDVKKHSILLSLIAVLRFIFSELLFYPLGVFLSFPLFSKEIDNSGQKRSSRASLLPAFSSELSSSDIPLLYIGCLMFITFLIWGFFSTYFDLNVRIFNSSHQVIRRDNKVEAYLKLLFLSVLIFEHHLFPKKWGAAWLLTAFWTGFYLRRNDESLVSYQVKKWYIALSSLSFWISLSFALSVFVGNVMREGFIWVMGFSLVLLLFSFLFRNNDKDLELFLNKQHCMNESPTLSLGLIEKLILVYENSQNGSQSDSVFLSGYMENLVHDTKQEDAELLHLMSNEASSFSDLNSQKARKTAFFSYISFLYLQAFSRFTQCFNLRLSYVLFLFDHLKKRTLAFNQFSLLKHKKEESYSNLYKLESVSVA